MKVEYSVIDRGTGKKIKKSFVSVPKIKDKRKMEDVARQKAMEKEGVDHPWDIMLETL